MTLQEAQALSNPLVRCLDGRIGHMVRLRVNYVAAMAAEHDEVGVRVRGEDALRWIPAQCLKPGKEGFCQEVAGR
ncbi:MAG: hypothetical protein AB7N91_19440 [Candidatus Tectimicrobiota bacterium]